MRLTLAALALLATIAAANATDWACTNWGNTTTCSDGRGNTYSCSHWGNTTTCR